MIALIRFLLAILTSPFKSKSRLEAENAALRQQLVVLQRKVKSRVALSNGDRLFFVQLYRWFPSILEVLTIIQPETFVRWHRAGFRRYWRWRSRRRGGRPQIPTELRALIRQMSVENRLWGAPRIHGELLKLGFEVSQSTVAKYTGALDQAAPLQGWTLPETLAHLRRLLETRMGKRGKREFIQVLRLTEVFPEAVVIGAALDAIRLGAIGFDAVKQLVIARTENRPARLDLSAYPYLPSPSVKTTLPADYLTLVSREAA